MYPGATYRENFVVTDNSNVPVLGATYSLVDMAGPQAWVGSVIELGGGVYQVVVQTLTSWQAGVYTATIRPDDPAHPEFFLDFTLDVPQAETPGGGVTFRELRRQIAGQMRDLLVITATSGSENTVIDPLELTESDQAYTGSQMRCTRSAHPENLGRVVRVMASRQQTTAISFAPALPQPVMPGDEFEVTNLRGNGFKAQEYDREIQMAVKGLASGYFRRASSDPVELEWDNMILPIPAEWRGVYRVDILFDDQPPYLIRAARSAHEAGWYVNQANRTVELRGRDAQACAGQQAILRGLVPHPLMLEDDDVCYIDDLFITLTVKSNLSAMRGSREANQWAVQWAQQAAAQRPAKLFRYPADTVLLEE